METIDPKATLAIITDPQTQAQVVQVTPPPPPTPQAVTFTIDTLLSQKDTEANKVKALDTYIIKATSDRSEAQLRLDTIQKAIDLYNASQQGQVTP